MIALDDPEEGAVVNDQDDHYGWDDNFESLGFYDIFNGIYDTDDLNGTAKETYELPDFGRSDESAPVPLPQAQSLPIPPLSGRISPSTLNISDQTPSREVTLSLTPCRSKTSRDTVTETQMQVCAGSYGPQTVSAHPVSKDTSPEGRDEQSSSGARPKRGTAHEAGSGSPSLPKSKKRSVDLISWSPRIVTTHTNGSQTTVLGTSNRKAKAPYTEQDRKNTALCRLTGACFQCKKKKRRCDLHEKSKYELCSNCAKMRPQKVLQMPCFLSEIADCVFFRNRPSFKGPQYFDRQAVYELSDIPALPGSGDLVVKVETLELSQIRDAKLLIYVDRYKPQAGDILDWTKVNEEGKKFTMKMPPYSLTQMDKNRNNMTMYVLKNRPLYLSMLQNGTDITWLTAETAMKYAETHRGSMTDMALNLWACCRIIELPWKICGDDTLGVEKGDPESPWPDYVPVTPMIDVQLDQIVIKDILQKLRTKLLGAIANAVNDYGPERWFDCYLAIFIILNHIEHAARHCHQFSLSFGMDRRFSDMELVRGWFHSCKTLLSRFHFISHGSGPFRTDWNNKKNTQFARLDDDQTDFVKKVQTLAISRENDFKSIKAESQYEHDMYWTHQMLEEKWTPGPSNIVEAVLH